MALILEGIITTIRADGSPHIAPMGPRVESVPFSRFTLRPYESSHTLEHLRATRRGVLHFTDNVHMLAAAAIGKLKPLPQMRPAPNNLGPILTDACRWHAFRVEEIIDESPRVRLECSVVAEGQQREFIGFNRAKHAVVEAAILATRLRWLPLDSVREQLAALRVLIDKTAGPQETLAFSLIETHVDAFADNDRLEEHSR